MLNFFLNWKSEFLSMIKFIRSCWRGHFNAIFFTFSCSTIVSIVVSESLIYFVVELIVKSFSDPFLDENVKYQNSHHCTDKANEAADEDEVGQMDWVEIVWSLKWLQIWTFWRRVFKGIAKGFHQVVDVQITAFEIRTVDENKRRIIDEQVLEIFMVSCQLLTAFHARTFLAVSKFTSRVRAYSIFICFVCTLQKLV